MGREKKCGLNIFRILCCIGVLNYHVMQYIRTIPMAKFIYFASSYCVLGFFMLSGYLLAKKSTIEFEYYESKIKCIMGKLLGWVSLWVVVHYVVTRELYNIVEEFIAGIDSRGILPVSWYLFSYTVLMIIGRILIILLKKTPVFFGILTFVLLIFSGNMDFIKNSMAQVLWLHIYLPYFMLGMLVCHYDIINNKKVKTFLISFCGIAFILCSIVYIYKVCMASEHLMPDQCYGQWYYTLWILALFILVCSVKMDNMLINNLVDRVASNTFTVYMWHLPIIAGLIREGGTISSVKDGIVLVVILFLGGILLAELLRKFPLLRKLV